MNVRRGFYIALQTMNTALFIGGAYMFITWSIVLAARLADYEARGGLDGIRADIESDEIVWSNA